MNISPDAERPAGPPPGQGFFEWIRGLDLGRSSDRWFAGVAGGIAAKAGIDPIIVRGVFVVLALLGGPGILLYVLGWLFLPDASGRIHVEDIVRGRAQTGVLIAAIVFASVVVVPVLISIVIPSATGFPVFSVWNWDVWSAIGVPNWLTTTIGWLIWIAVIVFGIIWVRRYFLRRGQAQAHSAQAQPGQAQPTDAGMASGSRTGETGPAGSPHTQAPHSEAYSTQAPPIPTDPWSPEDISERANQFAAQTEEFANRVGDRATEWGRRAEHATESWGRDLNRRTDEWSARYAEHHEATRIGAAHVIITIALALFAGGAAVLWARATGQVAGVEGQPAPAFIAGIVGALAVIAVSLIIAGARGRNTGTVGFLAFCGVIALLVTTILPWGSQYQAFGNVRATGDTASGVVLIAGNTEVDLSDLDEHGGENRDRQAHIEQDQPLEVWQAFGNSTVRLPDEHPVVVDVRLFAGRIDETAGSESDRVRSSGPLLHRTITANLPEGMGLSAARRSDQVATVQVNLLAGQIKAVQPETRTVERAEESAR